MNRDKDEGKKSETKNIPKADVAPKSSIPDKSAITGESTKEIVENKKSGFSVLKKSSHNVTLKNKEDGSNYLDDDDIDPTWDM